MFTKSGLQKAIVSFIMSFLVEKLGSYWTDFCEILWCFDFDENGTKITDTLHEDLHTFMVVSHHSQGKYKKYNR
jgi:hypothetical protein